MAYALAEKDHLTCSPGCVPRPHFAQYQHAALRQNGDGTDYFDDDHLPVFALFQLSQDDLALKLDRYQEQMNRPSDTEWKRIAERLAGKQEKQIDAYVQSQVEASIRTKLKEDHGVEVTAVKVLLDNKNADQAKLQRIEVAIAPEGSSGETASAIKPVEPIEPIRIEVNSQSQGQEEKELLTAAQQKDALSKRIASDLAAQWGLSEDMVVVTRDQDKIEKR